MNMFILLSLSRTLNVETHQIHRYNQPLAWCGTTGAHKFINAPVDALVAATARNMFKQDCPT